LKRQLKQQNVAELLEQKEEAITQLEALVAQKELSLSELEPVIVRIERALEGFIVDTLPAGFDATLVQRLQAILQLINQIRQAFDQQKASVDKLTATTTKQRDAIMQLTRESSSFK
jgi:hypothetical protein